MDQEKNSYDGGIDDNVIQEWSFLDIKTCLYLMYSACARQRHHRNFYVDPYYYFNFISIMFCICIHIGILSFIFIYFYFQYYLNPNFNFCFYLYFYVDPGSTALHLAAASGHHSICSVLSDQPDIQLLSKDSEGTACVSE